MSLTTVCDGIIKFDGGLDVKSCEHVSIISYVPKSNHIWSLCKLNPQQSSYLSSLTNIFHVLDMVENAKGEQKDRYTLPLI